MNYHGFTQPAFSRSDHHLADWMEWLYEQDDVLLPVAPHHSQSCNSCFGASAYIDDGPDTWPYCWNCRQFGDSVDALVPITYSIDSGLESMLRRYKDFDGYRWLRKPLASLLHEFIDVHGNCLDRQSLYGRIDVATTMPPGTIRATNHLDRLISGIVNGDPLMERWNWNMNFLTRDPSVAKPARQQLKPEAYQVERSIVEGSSVLLFDDTWTSGASAASAAEALKNAGAAYVTVLTLGRQLNFGNHFGSSRAIYDDVHGADWDPRDCVICA